jgi:hypothetical protein
MNSPTKQRGAHAPVLSNRVTTAFNARS